MDRRLALLGLLAVFLGCDKTPEVPPQVNEAPKTEEKAEDTKPKGPTTQELLTGPRKTISLAYIPFKLTVPPGWAVKTDENSAMAYLRGTTPSGREAQAYLTPRPTLSATKLEYLLSGARSDAEKRKDRTKKFDIRHTGDLTILEKQETSEPIIMPDADPKTVDTSPSFRWTTNIFVPRGKEYLQYEINFLGMSLNQFNADREFLESIYKTLEPENAAGPTTQP